MAKKKAGKRQIKSQAPQSTIRRGKSGSSRTGDRGAGKAKGNAARAAKTRARAARRPQHRDMRIGLTKKSNNTAFPIHVGGDNTFVVYGDGIGSAHPVNNPAHIKRAHVTSNSHEWADPPSRLSDVGRDALEIRCRCIRRKPRTARLLSADGSDDLTVTITVDEGTGLPTEEETVCTFAAVDYDA